MTIEEMYAQLNAENKEYINRLVAQLITKQLASGQILDSQE